MDDLSVFEGEDVVVTVKMDGENANLLRGLYHARSTEPATGFDRSMVRAIHGRISHEIPEGWRICGENVYIEHSIHYRHLKAWLYVFGIWDDLNMCLSWDETLEWCGLLDLTPVPVIYRGVWDENVLRSIPVVEYDGDEMEGFVVRVSRGFSFDEFGISVAKYVRPDHVKSDRHWRHNTMIPNEMGGED